MRWGVLAVMLAAICITSCGGGASGTGGPTPPPAPPPPPPPPPTPPPGPNWSVLPVPIEKLARITPLGHNNKTMPNDGTYWITCDEGRWLMPSPRPCVRERLPLRAPGDGVVLRVEAGPDGAVTLEGPPGLIINFGHVTPAVGLAAGHPVKAGDVVATMFYDYSVDVNVYNLGVTQHPFLNPARFPQPARFAQHVIEQYPEPLRSQLIALVQTTGDPIGRLVWDVAGTASGGWFLEGTPVDRSMTFEYFPSHLYLGRLEERHATRMMAVGENWAGQLNPLMMIDPAAPSWEAITPASGFVTLKAWHLNRDGTPNLDWSHGTIAIQMLSPTRLRLEWFDTHGAVAGFTAAARIYER